MHHHEKLAFFKFFVTYFVSVAFLILAAGFFYFSQLKNHYLRVEEFSLIEYARHIKMGNNMDEYVKYYHHNYLDINKHIDIRNFTIAEYEFSKIIPMKRNREYLQVHKSKLIYDNKLYSMKIKIIITQIFLLLLFAYISYRLAKSALKPLQESIATLDKFIKDLIHDLNTPVTAIKLNMQLLQKVPELKDNKAIKRLKKSVYTISELHENLTILLEEETFQMQIFNVCEIVADVVQIQKQLYPDIVFKVECANFKAKFNQNATKQILQNIISNACKYNSQHGHVNIYIKDDALCIADSGNGIKEPSKIFERSYSEENSSGLGLDIVKRLSDAMDINIELTTSKKGSCFILNFKRS
ncbi:MAG: HAMP domain-containing sensor histidine kinase [Sulfurimonas sp.]